MINNLKTLMHTMCSNYKLQNALILEPNKDVQGPLKYWDVFCSVLSTDSRPGIAFEDNYDFDMFPTDYDFVFINRYGSYLFRHRLVQHLVDNGVKFILLEKGSLEYRNRKYAPVRFISDATEYVLLYADALKQALNEIETDPQERQFLC